MEKKDLYGSLNPYIYPKDANSAINFYKDVFGAVEIFRLGKNGRVDHAELLMGDRVLMLSDQMAGNNYDNCGNILLGLYVNDVDLVCKKVEELGGKILEKPRNYFYGDRMATVMDPYGIKWGLSTKVENVSNDEIIKRYNNMDMTKNDDNTYKEKYMKYKQKYLELCKQKDNKKN